MNPPPSPAGGRRRNSRNLLIRRSVSYATVVVVTHTRPAVTLQELSGDDSSLLWALRRKLAKELFYDERGKPMHRKLLKATNAGNSKTSVRFARASCPRRTQCSSGTKAMKGYTSENTRLICPECDVKIQTERGYA